MKNKKSGVLKKNFLRLCTLSNLREVINIHVRSKSKGDYTNLLLHICVDCNIVSILPLSGITSYVIINGNFCLSKFMTGIYSALWRVTQRITREQVFVNKFLFIVIFIIEEWYSSTE